MEFRIFVLKANSFLDKHRDSNIAKYYDNVIEKFRQT